MLVTIPELFARATSLLERLQRAGVRVNPSSRLWRYVRELEAAVPLQYSMPTDAIVRRWHGLLIEVGDLERIVESLGVHPATEGWAESVAESLSGSFLPTDEEKHSRARDIQFELLVAATLKNCGYQPALAEPDIRLDVMGSTIGIAAKRPRSRSKLQKVVKGAAKQVIALDLQGLVAVDVSVVANPEGKHLTTRDFAAAQAFATREGSNLGKHIGATIGARYGVANIFGVLVRFAMPVWEPAERRLSFVNQWPIISLVGEADPRRQICEDLYARLMAA